MSFDGELRDLQSRMKNEWDDRVRHDYRYWMSDGIKNDEEMWTTGKRDFEILTNGISDDFLKQARVLDLGCGVGRVLKSVLEVCKEGIGVDVSEEAINSAKEFLTDYSNSRIIQSNGFDISNVKNGEIDLAISFAAIGSMPSKVFAAYLAELSRVISVGGLIRLQVYLGKEQIINEEDTLALRSYEKERFFSALAKAGFTHSYTQEVVLPFEVSDYENGIVAYIIGGKRTNRACSDVSVLYETLVSKDETRAGENWSGSETAYFVSLARAKQELAEGNISKAEKSVSFAKKMFKGDTSQADELLAEIRSRLTKSDEILKTMSEVEVQNSSDIEFNETNDGTVFKYKGINLSHQNFPEKAAKNWAERCFKSIEDKDKPVLMIGLGDRYFANALAERLNNNIFVYDSNPDILSINEGQVSSNIKLIRSHSELERYIKQFFNDTIPELVILPAAPFYLNEEIDYVKKTISSRQLLQTLRPNVGIVGPLYGGSLPIAEYANRACRSLGLKSHYIDLSSYHTPYASFENILKNRSGRNIIENNFVELISELVFQVVCERKIDILISVAQAPLSTKVLEKCRSKGIITAHWFMEDINRFHTWKQIAKYYDYFFIIQKDEAIEKVKQHGGNRVFYMPLACDPEIHAPCNLTPHEKLEFGSTVSFVGAGYNNRKYVFSKLAKEDFKIWGTEWPDVVPFSQIVQRKGARVSVSDYVKIFNASEININLHSSTEKNGIDPTGDFVNPRTFELAACKAFQLTDKRSLLSELFSSDEIVTFENEYDLKEKIEFYKSHPEKRAEFVDKAYRRVINDHTYQKRITSMLECIYTDFGKQLKNKNESDDWNKTLKAASSLSDKELTEILEKTKSRGDEPKLDYIVSDIISRSGKLSDPEKKLLFLYHMRGQISHIHKLRKVDNA